MGLRQENKPGFQRSDTTSVEVRIYHRDDNPIIFTQAVSKFAPKRPARDQKGMIVSVSTSSMMGSPAGDFSIVLKPGKLDIFKTVSDDDWVDIIFRKFGRKWHTFRGIVKHVRRSRVVAGATSQSYIITGKEWGHIFEITPIWFDRFTTENLAGAASYRVFSTENIGGSVANVVEGFLFGFLRELAGVGRFAWKLPKSMPGSKGNSGFLENVTLDTRRWADDPERIAVTPSLTQPSGNAWSLAQQWSDPVFCELFTDLELAPGDSAFFDGEFAPESGGMGPEAPPERTRMTVILRDRPFPTAADQGAAWSKLPTFVIPRQAIAEDEVGRGGEERFNAFFVGPQMLQEMVGTHAIDLCRPLWYVDDIKIHGLRRFDLSTNYLAKEGKSLGMALALRERARDWYCLNPYFYSGSLSLTHGRPDIHKGAKVRVPGARGVDEDETYYVEGIDQEWTFGRGLRTGLTVTRGWIGQESGLVSAVNAIGSLYTSPEEAVSPGA
jgi:hypothetical protein